MTITTATDIIFFDEQGNEYTVSLEEWDAEPVSILPECATYIGKDLWKGDSGKTYLLR